MIRPEKRVLLSDDPHDRIEDGPQMQFRLTYEGELFASQPGNIFFRNGNKRLMHKHNLRQRFHHQIKRLWEVAPFLNAGKSSGPELDGVVETTLPALIDRSRLAKMHYHYGFNFIPLVTSELHVLCGLDFLILRPDPLNDIRSADIDNRVKTLIDVLSIPDAYERYDAIQPDPEYTPFYCLLENDRLITKISVETDQLLDRSDPKLDRSDSKVLITVNLRPYELHLGNMGIGA